MDGDHHRRLEISPIFIGTLGILAGAIIVAAYHMIITSCCQTRGAVDPPRTARSSTPDQDSLQRRTSTSPTLRYVKDYNEEICSVCLGEFIEGERIRVLPECSHLFHVECIDKWLYSHSNCPLCRTSTLAPAHLVLSITDSGGTQVQQPQEIQPHVILVNDE